MTLTLQQLKTQAEQLTANRKHITAEWIDSTSDARQTSVMTCAVCGAYVQVNTNPLPNQIDIGGSAVALNCTPKKRAEYIDTTWEVRSYDVWGNESEGFEVNDSHVVAREYSIRCKVEVHNVGTPQEFRSASPSDSQIREALSLRRFKLDTDGDDLHVYVNRARDGYPCGELFCTSHESLSPIRPKKA